MASASSATADDLRATLVDFCRVTKTIGRAEEKPLHRLLEVLKHHLKSKCIALVEAAAHFPVLWSYSCDATPLKTSVTQTSSHEGATVVRRGRVLHELLLERGFVKCKGASGQDEVAFMYSDIRSLADGKKTWNLFTASATFFPLLRKVGHKGITVHHHCMDRGVFSSLDRCLRQRHQAYYTTGLGPDLGQEAFLLELTDWIVGTPCMVHDVHKSLQWALAGVSSAEAVKDLHIVIEALRNSFSLLTKRMPVFLNRYLARRDEPVDHDAAIDFWRAMGVEASMLESVAEVHPLWENGLLCVNTSLEEGNVIEKVSHILLYLCKWRKFTDSRWVTVGPACRTLLWGLLVGLDKWVDLTRKDPSASDAFLHGFTKLSTTMRRYCIVASLVAHVPDAVLAEALVDDRLVRRAAALKEAMLDELVWVEGIEASIWATLATVVGDSEEPMALQNTTANCCHIAAAFVQHKVFNAVEGYPWKLAVGDVDQNLDTLASSTEEFADACTHKVRLLLQKGFPKEQLKRGIALFLEIPWSSVPVEQAHASAAVLHRYHPDYGVNMLTARATLHQCRHLFFDPPEVRKEARAAARVDTLSRKDPLKVSGKHVFLAELMQSAKASLPVGAKLPKAVVREVVKRHNGLFKALSLEEQEAFHAKARGQALKKVFALEEDIAHLRDAMRLRVARDHEELVAEGLYNRVTVARFGPDDYVRLGDHLASSAFNGSEVKALREAAECPPKAPPPEVITALQKCPTMAAHVPNTALPEWLKELCRKRSEITGCVFGTSLEEGAKAYAWLFASQSPFAAHFLTLEVSRPTMPELGSLEYEELMDQWDSWRPFSFKVLYGQYHESGAVLLGANEDDILVWQHVGRTPPGGMGTLSRPIGLHEFLSTLSSGEKEPVAKAPAAKKAKVDIDPAMLAQFPWLADLGQGGKDAAASGHSETQEACESDDSPAEPAVDEDAVLAQAWADLQSKRQEWQAAPPPEGDDFETAWQSGNWTWGDRDKIYDASVARAKPGAPKQWCTQYSLPKLATYSSDLHGLETALALSMEWCARMQHYYDLRHSQPEGYVYTKADKASYKPSQAWLDLVNSLPTFGKTRERTHAIESLFPGAPT